LARASLRAATEGSARDQAFNVVNEPVRWRRIWGKLAAALVLPIGPPVPMRLAVHRADARAVGWGLGDFAFHSAFDLVSDMGTIWRAGFDESVDSAAVLLSAIGRLQAARVLRR